jgi:hypothetical protein
MAKKQIKPLFELKADYDNSLHNFISRATILADAIRPLLQHNLISNKEVAALVKEKLDAFDAAK